MTELYAPKNRSMHVAAFMSGSGSNVVKLIEYSRSREAGFDISLIFTDKPKMSRAAEIAEKYGIPFYGTPFIQWHKDNNIDPQVDKGCFYEPIVETLSELAIDAVALGGYMRMIPKSFIEKFPLTVNVHPADLAERGPSGRPLYAGDHAMELVMAAGESYMRASTILVDQGEDTGPLLMRSARLPIDYAKSEDENQNVLKKGGDHVIFPLTLELIAKGRYSMDAKKNMYFDGTYIPRGVDMETYK